MYQHSRCKMSILVLCAYVMKIVRTGVLISLVLQVEAVFNNFVQLKCPADCSRMLCGKLKILKSLCRAAGTVYDTCGCCQVCAKAADENCGGQEGIYGKCGRGLYCFLPNHRIQDMGRCRPIPKRPPSQSFTLQIENSVEVKCKPRCSQDFCSKWPDAVCSATDNVVIRRTCQQPCQHTVCQACYFKTKREPPCPKCATDDFGCMKRFSKCVRKDACTRHKYPCEPHQKRKSDGRFVCKVPACLT
ncbi:cysteine-rich motor neuron 1 protein-like isoform X1 [Hydractinia symbiolongicarpus]|uniref:cysteine-rich motor neuron 1 protein-like isoform X1 n=2 Tax=Hydractinia symbiolongicarpus TaxID=13093 RepID=UPI00254A2167|nr:cysteine-rich motor neuron 1 protein-like isoform X1 [Hydractinia symbiolongicarpus]XP_057312019.1 cysteine-rich motor neuron 1 protein-like isoform X1 [Hydractinia symbiolongicarpus]